MSVASSHARGHAIVIGGSMAGLLAARVLSDHYREVTIVERDPLPRDAEQRRGVPQGRHAHGLLASGHDVLESLFPGISESLIRSGAISGDIVRDCRWFFEGGCLARCPSTLKGLAVSRPFLEAHVRSRVLGLPNIRLRDNAPVEGLPFNETCSNITGVTIAGERLPADLTVDATGRGSRTPDWLSSNGYSKPAEERVEIGLCYTTRFFRRNSADLGGDTAVIIPPTPEGKRGGAMIAQEGDRWITTLMVHFGKPAPEELPGFIEFARTLPAPYIHEVIQRAEPLSAASTIRYPRSIRRRYEKLTRFPGGFLVFGDAISSFNPIYGQGMSVAALQAVELHKVLSEAEEDLAKRFFARASKVVDIPWTIAVGNDLRMSEAVGPRTLGTRLVNWYMEKLHKAAHGDPELALTFHKVGNLLAPPQAVMHPRIARRVLRQTLRPSRPADPEQSRAARSGT